MATQLGQRPSRVESDRGQELERPIRIERISNSNNYTNPINQINNIKNVAGNVLKKPLTLNFICMIIVAGALDIIGLIANVIPGFGIILSIIYNVIFIPWFMFSGVKFNAKKISSMGATSILEYIPIIGNLPLMTTNIVYSYYSK